ncbi:hypothetical protein BSLG_005835 [Batrachochytrium salamandrivorans]|nr:hypothetical protein BSLG_005835 [Batrachochytrium salamandrivorans]
MRFARLSQCMASSWSSFTPLLQKQLMSLQELFDVMSATSEYMSMLPVQPAAVAGTLELLDGSLILKLMVEEGIDFSLCGQQTRPARLPQKVFTDANGFSNTDSPKFLKALTTAIVKCVASRTFESSDNKVEVPSPELYAAEKELMAQFVKMMMPYLVSNESKIEVLKGARHSAHPRNFPIVSFELHLFHDLMRMYHELDLIETSVFSNYLESIPLSSKIAHGIVQTWMFKNRYLSVHQTLDELVAVKSEIAILSKRVTDATLFLPLYDQRQCSLQLKDLNDQVTRIQGTRAKFSFKSSKSKPSTNTKLTVSEHVVSDTASHPIIEDCDEIGFTSFEPLLLTNFDESLKTVGLVATRNEFNKVEDFNWLRQQASPNWRVIDEPNVFKTWTDVSNDETGDLTKSLLMKFTPQY